MKRLMNALLTLSGLALHSPVIAAADSHVCDSIPQSTPEFDRATQKFKGCRLLAVEPGSSYAKLGLKKGSILFPMKGPAALGEEITADADPASPAPADASDSAIEKRPKSDCGKRGKGCAEISEDFFDAH